MQLGDCACENTLLFECWRQLLLLLLLCWMRLLRY